MSTALDLLREMASLKRYGKNGHPSRSGNFVTVNLTADLLARIDALLAAPRPYAYEVEDSLGGHELIYAQAATADDLERPHVPLYR